MANNPAQNKKKLNDCSQDELIDIIKQLRKRKRYGLVWEEKPERVVDQCKKELPVLDQDQDMAIEKNPAGRTNLMIEGDNYHALSVLNYTHAGKIDVIYIDPPYNTGSNDFMYNDSYVDKEDSFRHSKWLSFMNSRLTLAKGLLSMDGIIFISIDDNEVAQLKLLCNEIFGEQNFVGTITWEKRTKAQNTKTARDMFQTKTEYILVYKKSSDKIRFNLEVSGEKVYDKEDKKGLYRLKHVEEMSAVGMRGRQTMVFEIKGISPRKGYQWKIGKDQIEEYKKRNDIEVVDGKVYLKTRPSDEDNQKFLPFWSHFFEKDTYGTAEKGKTELNEVLGTNEHGFETVKPVNLIKKLLFHINRGKNEVVLDFFAGSGTTAQAVMELNKEDGGSRQFILATNNENGIAEKITYPRIKKALSKATDKDSISANLRYFRTSFVTKNDVSDDTRRELVRRSVEMICVRENTFTKKYDNKDYKIYSNGKISTGVIFDLDSIEEFKEKIDKLKLPARIYVFSLSNDTYESDFADLDVRHKLCAIPESILEVYRKLFI